MPTFTTFLLSPSLTPTPCSGCLPQRAQRACRRWAACSMTVVEVYEDSRPRYCASSTPSGAWTTDYGERDLLLQCLLCLTVAKETLHAVRAAAGPSTTFDNIEGSTYRPSTRCSRRRRGGFDNLRALSASVSPPPPSSRVVAHLNADGERAARVTVSRPSPTSTSTPRLASTLAVTDPSNLGHPHPPPSVQALLGGYFDGLG